MVGLLDSQSKKEIVEAIREAEASTSGEIRVHLKRRCGKDVWEEAKKTFVRLGMHRTRLRNAILIFVALDNHRFAILGDGGIDEKTGGAFWNTTRDCMLSRFKDGKIKEGILAGIRNAGEKLKNHFPARPNNLNELSDRVTET